MSWSDNDGDTGVGSYSREYAYDKVGNRTQMTLVDYDGTVDRDITWKMDYNALNQLTYRYVDPWATGPTGEERFSYTYDDNGNLTQMKTETYNGGWTETLRWDYAWNPRDQMKKASKYVNGSLDGYVEYEYCLSCDGALSKRIQYDDSDDLEMAWRYEYDGLNLLRVDEVYDADSDSDLDDDYAANHWRIRETSTHRPGQLAAQLGKRVYEHTDNNANPDGYEDYTYAYDAVGNVVMVFDSAGIEEFHFAQDAFGNELEIAAFGATPWDTASAEGVNEHQTGKWVDSYTGLYYFQKRWYDSVVGRFVGREPERKDLFRRNCSSQVCTIAPANQYRSELGADAYDYCNNAPTMYFDTSGMRSHIPDDQPCPEGKVPIWHCRRYLGYPIINFGPFHHAYTCCEGKNKDCYGVQFGDREGQPVRPEVDPTGQCYKYCVRPDRKRKCCENPKNTWDYHIAILYDCQVFANNCAEVWAPDD